MYNTQKVYDSFKGLVGWKQPTNFLFDLSTENKASSSNRFFTDNDFVKLDFILNTQENKAIDEVEFQNLLDSFVRRGLNNLLDAVFSMPDFIDRQLLYKYPNNKVETEALPINHFVGVQIEPHPMKNNLAFEITRVLLEFENTPNDIEIVLYNSAKKEAIKTSGLVSVTSELQSLELNWVLDDTEGLYRGEYFLGYRTAETQLQPIKREYELADIPTILTDIYTVPIEAPMTGTALFDLDDIDNSEETWGINPDITVFQDFTDMAIQNKRLFAAALQMSVQVEVLESYMASNRSNREERISNDLLQKILVELNGISTQSYTSGGLKNALKAEITALKREKLKLTQGYFDTHSLTSVTRS